jgi:hypothetical protein
MIDKYKGVVEVEILGEKRGFKFGMAAMAQLCQLEGTNLKGVQERLGEGEIGTMVNLLFAAAYQYAALNKAEKPTYEEVANWIDHLEGKENEILQAAFYQHKDPN